MTKYTALSQQDSLQESIHESKEQTQPLLTYEAFRVSQFSTSESRFALLLIIFLLVNVACFATTVVQIGSISNIVMAQLDLTDARNLPRHNSGRLMDIF